MSNTVAAWRSRRLQRRAETEARQLVAEARRVLKKKSYRIPESVAAEVELAAVAVESAVAGPELDVLRQAITTLDEKMDQHLAFARKSTLREYSESIGVAVAIALLLRAFVVEAFQIPSGSMIPTLEIGDHIFVSKFAYGVAIPFTDTKVLQFSEPRRGDVIVFKYPQGPEIDYIKRVVGLPGDELEVRRNEVFLNGQPVSREFQNEPCHYSEGPVFEGVRMERECELWIETLDGRSHRIIHNAGSGGGEGPGVKHVVPPGHVFVMGDNRDNSNDSRVWGFVPYKYIKGRALIVWWSRGPTTGTWSFEGAGEWFKAIRWRRFFQVVD